MTREIREVYSLILLESIALPITKNLQAPYNKQMTSWTASSYKRSQRSMIFSINDIYHNYWLLSIKMQVDENHS